MNCTRVSRTVPGEKRLALLILTALTVLICAPAQAQETPDAAGGGEGTEPTQPTTDKVKTIAEASEKKVEPAKAETIVETGEVTDEKKDEVKEEAKAAAPAVEPPDAMKFEVSGLYTIWGLNQRGFLLGADNPLDNADYVVQMLRTNLKFGKKHYGVKARVDAAQGWWGTDNSPNNEPSVTQAADGTLTTGVTYNPYKLFRNKDTNYAIHVDHAYLYVDIPKTPIQVTAGRQAYEVGNKLVLDHDHDGIIVTGTFGEKVKVDALWAKVSEGRDSFKAPTGALMNDDEARADADIFGGRVKVDYAPVKVEAFGLLYKDNSGQEDYAYLPNGLGYLQSRFTPQLSEVWAFGLAGNLHLDVLAGLDVDVEVDYLTGKDLVDNTTTAGGLIDINDGTLQGTNVLFKATQKAKLGVPMDLGLTFGWGSGDDDPTSGKGNINKIQTMGFFPLTNVWEDSVMPDIAGISPQGLGSPVSRGYRELENTTVVMAKVGVKPVELLRLEASFTFIQATQPVHGFDAGGAPTAETAKDLGQEVDANLILNVYDNVTYKALFGYFVPGDAAALLINGNTDHKDPAWELKQVVDVKF